MEVQVKFISKSTVWIRALIYNESGALVDPSTSVKVTLLDPAGTKQLDDVAMIYTAVGTYDYYYTVASDAVEGWWPGEVWATDGSYKSLGQFGFEVSHGLTA